MTVLLVSLAVVALLLLGLGLLRWRDRRAEQAEWVRLVACQPADPARFDPATLAGLPEPAQRYFRFVIQPGTALLPVAEIDMVGRFCLGTREVPNEQPMQAREMLAVPHGFIWRVTLAGAVPISGSDAGSPEGGWTRFALFGLMPVARLGGDADHTRAAFGRYVAEAVFWTPAALLPGPDVRWEAVDADTARMTLRAGGLVQTVEVMVAADGQPTQVVFPRWSNANADKQFRLQPFGGTLADFREVRGYRLPFRVEAGNFFGTPEYFPFFKAEVTAIRFPDAG